MGPLAEKTNLCPPAMKALHIGGGGGRGGRTQGTTEMRAL